MRARAALLTMLAGVLGADGTAEPLREALAAAQRPEPGWRPLTSPKEEERLRARLDASHVGFYLREEGRHVDFVTEEDQRAVAEQAIRRIVREGVHLGEPRLMAALEESGIHLRSHRIHHGEPAGAASAPAAGRRVDVDLGLRGGKPYVGADLGPTRVTLAYDWRDRATKLEVRGKLGPVAARLHVTDAETREVSAGVAIPVRW